MGNHIYDNNSNYFICCNWVILAIVLVVTDEKGIKPNKIIYGILSAIINVLRSVPLLFLQ